MAEGLISTLSIKVQADAADASKAIDKLVQSLTKLKSAVSGISSGNLEGLAKSLESIAKSASMIDDSSLQKITSLSSALGTLSKVHSPATISEKSTAGISEIVNTARQATNEDIQRISRIGTAISALANASVPKDFTKTANNLKKFGEAAASINSNGIDSIVNLSMALDILAGSDPTENFNRTSTAVAKLSTSLEALEKSHIETVTDRLTGLRDAFNGIINNESSQITSNFNATATAVARLSKSLADLQDAKIKDIRVQLGSLANAFSFVLANSQDTTNFNNTANAISKLTSSMNGLAGIESDTVIKTLQGIANVINNSLATTADTESFGKTVSSIARAVNALGKMDAGTVSKNMETLASSIRANTESFPEAENFYATVSSLSRAINALTKANVEQLSAKMATFSSALQQGASGFQANEEFQQTVSSLARAINALTNMDIGSITTKIQQFTNALQPMVAQLQQAQPALTAFASAMQQFNTYNNKGASASGGSGKSISSKSSLGILSNFSRYFNWRFLLNGLRRIYRAVKDCVTESTEYEETLNLFNVAMGTGAQEAYEFAESVSELVGIDIAEWMEGQGTLNTLIEGFGVASDRAQTMSKQLTQLAYDISSYYNTSVEDAFAKLESGMSGSARAVRSYGVDVSEMKLKEVALELGISKSVSAMTQAEKAQLRYYTIMKQTTNVQGDMARTIQTPANQLRILSAQAQMAARAIGNLFIPALNAILPVAIVVIKAITAVTRAIASLFGYTLTDVDYSGLTDLGAEVDDVDDSLESAGDSAKKLKDYVMGFDELNVLNADSSSGSGGSGGSSSVGTGSDWDWELPTYDFLDNLTEGTLFNKITERLNKFSAKVAKLIEKQDYRGIGVAIGNLFNEGVNAVDWENLGSNVATNLNNVFAVIDGYLDKSNTKAGGVAFGNLLSGFFKNIDAETFGEIATESVTNIIDSAIGFIEAFDVSEFVGSLEDFVNGTLEKLRKWVEKTNFNKLVDSLVAKAIALLSSVSSSTELLNEINNLASTIANQVLTSITMSLTINLPQMLISVVKSIFTTIVNFMTSIVTGFDGIIEGFFEAIKGRIIPGYEANTDFNRSVDSYIEELDKLDEAYGNVEDAVYDVQTALTKWSDITKINDLAIIYQLGLDVVEELKKGIQQGLKEEDISNTIKNAINSGVVDEKTVKEKGAAWAKAFINGLSQKMKQLGYDTLDELIGGGYNPLNIPTGYAVGGFPTTGQMFIAREAGPEMVGTIGGHTAVANNDQIVQGISSGVYSAVVSAMSQSNGSTSVNVYLDGKQIRQSIIKANHNAGVSVGKGGVVLG